MENSKILQKKKVRAYKKHIQPIYFDFNKTALMRLADWFRFILLIIPLTITILLVVHYSNQLWWYISIAVDSPIILPTLILFLIDIAYKIRKKAFDSSIDPAMPVRMFFGNWGTGKTSMMLYVAVVMAKKKWKYICRKYKRLSCYTKEQINAWENKKKKDEALEIIETYEFYKKCKTVPCLWSTVPLFVNGVPANRLTANHLLQRKKLPYGTVAACDEISLIFPQELWRNKPWELREMLKFGRQFLDLKLLTNEQAKENELNDIRRVTTQNQLMKKQTAALKPKFLLWLVDFLTDHLPMTKFLDTFLGTIEEFAKYVGYRKYTYRLFGTEYEPEITKAKTCVIPSYMDGIEYDDRAYREGYRAKNLPLEESKWTDIRFTKEDLALIFTDEIKEKSESKHQRREKAEKARLEKQNTQNKEKTNG